MDPFIKIHPLPIDYAWGALPAFYFYLTGLSAASFVISTLANVFGMVKFKAVGRVGAVLAPLCLVLAPATLILDLESPERFWYLLQYNFIPHFHPTSPMAFGTWLLMIYPLEAIVYAYFLFTGNQKMAKVFGLIGIPLAISVHGYTGFVLAVVPGKHLWNTALMPFLFLISAMVSGYALVILASILKEKYISNSKWLKERRPQHLKLFNDYFPTIEKEAVSDLAKHLIGFIALDLFLIFSAVIVMLMATEESYHTVMSLLAGRFAPFFLGIEIFLGLLIPLFILSYQRTRAIQTWQVVASALVLIGVMTMRYTFIVAGQSFPVQLL
jgi:formate-dependent nitrite reductase membrane component NrfD